MIKALFFFFCTLGIWLISPVTVVGMTLRYGLVIGNNDGLDENGSRPFPKLRHAEREAEALYKRLSKLANFDSQAGRITLLKGATTAHVNRAVAKIIKQKARDKKRFGDPDSLFLFFFTGHGLNGKILMHDGPLNGDRIGEIFRAVGAEFNIGVFDACYSGSLDQEALLEKGLVVTQGSNLFKELPEEVLTSEGSVWFVSSGSSAVSYEDSRLGGVFSHFFTEALDHAKASGPGITLDQIWHYARTKTKSYTVSKGRPQVPEQFVARLRSTAPLYFSFPLERTSTLVLGERVSGEFVLAYADGQLIETLKKTPGTELERPVYPGWARLLLLDEGEYLLQEDLYFTPNSRVVIRTNATAKKRASVGQAHDQLWTKGVDTQTFVATHSYPGTTVELGAGWYHSFIGEGFLSPHDSFFALGQIDRELFTARLAAGYGRTKASFDSWSYKLNTMALAASAGLGIDLGQTRLNPALGFGMNVYWQEFDQGIERTTYALHPHGALSLVFPRSTPLLFSVDLTGSISRSPGINLHNDFYWHPRFTLGLSVLFRVN